MISKQRYIDGINKFEEEAGESFADYFMHDNVKPLSWSFWLLGKGFDKHALNIINKIEKGITYHDQEELFEIYPIYIGPNEDFNQSNYDKNIEIWAEFLSATSSYRKRTQKFFKNNKIKL